MNTIKIIFSVFILAGSFSINAQEISLIPQKLSKIFSVAPPQFKKGYVFQKTNSWGVKFSDLKDDYLSPNNYRGLSLTYLSVTIKPFEWFDFSKGIPSGSIFAYYPSYVVDNWIIYDNCEISIGSAVSYAKNRGIYFFDAVINKSYMRGYRLNSFGKLYIGLGAGINLGSIYSGINGNNPVSLKLNSSLITSLLYNYRIPFRSYPMNFRLLVSSSLCGLSFSPEFGESYYEIFSLQDNGFLNRLYFVSLKKFRDNKIKLSIDIPAIDLFIINIGLFYSVYNTNINKLNVENNSFGISLGFTNWRYPISGRGLYYNSKYNIPL